MGDVHNRFLGFNDSEVAALGIAYGLTQSILNAGWEGVTGLPQPATEAWGKLREELDTELTRRGLLRRCDELRPGARGLDALTEVPASEPCTAVLHHGPGHQSTTQCRLKGVHTVHEAVYGSPPTCAQWRGDEASTGFFDEPPQGDD